MTQTQVCALKDDYEPRINDIMRKWKSELVRRGYTDVSEPFEMHDDEFRWSITGTRPDGVRVDLTVTLLESGACGDDPGEGVNWSVNVFEEGGRMLGSFCPYNYTQEVWTDDRREIEARFRMIEDMEIEIAA